MKTREEIVNASIGRDEKWERVTRAFQRACSLYHRGREEEAMELAGLELPPLIESWSVNCPLNGSAKRHQLISLFMEEGRRMGEMSILQKMLFAQMNAKVQATRNARALFHGSSGLAGTIHLSKNEHLHTSEVA